MADRDWVRIVAEEVCAECGLRASEVPRESLPAALRLEASGWVVILTSPAVALRAHPQPGWSALEYAAHVRDVLDNFDQRVRRALLEDKPVFGWWDHESAVIVEAYNEQDPLLVGTALVVNAERLASTAAAVQEPEWSREGTRRPGETFTIEGLVRFALHEVRHHRGDAEAAAGHTSLEL